MPGQSQGEEDQVRDNFIVRCHTSHKLEVNEKHFETVDCFIHFGSLVKSYSSNGVEIRRRLMM